MNRQFSKPKYYKIQGMLANKHNITEHHAGCHIVHYPDGYLCRRCTRSEECANIFMKEKDSGIYKEE